jgi:signal transduction histidine kinase/ActR/RegA family two-component response regulator
MQPSRSRLALIGLALVYATLLANALIGYLNVRRLYDNDRWVIHTYEAIHAINVLFFSINDVETAQRGFVTTGESSYLNQYENSLVQAENALQSLAKLVADNSRRAEDIVKLKQQVARKLDAIREIVTVRKSEGFEAAQTLILSGESRRAMEALRETVSRMEFEEQLLLVDRQTQSEVSYWTAIVAGSVASVLGICLSVFASVLVWRDFETRGKYAANLRLVNDQLGSQAEQLAGINQSLEAEIAERTRIEEALHEADQRKDQFLATLAHELRNPLSPLMSAAQLLAMEPNCSPETKEMTAIMLRQVEQLKRLIDDLLDVSRISRGKLQLQLEPTQLSESVTAALDVSRPLIESKRHQFQVTLPEQPVVIRGDKVRLAQIMGNLLINAAKYTPPQGKIELQIEIVNRQAVIRVRDNGIGIAPEMLPRIFGLFTQADATNERSQGGLGIGLSLAKTLVEMHGGAIHAQSGGLGQGSEFTVSLPLATQSAAKPAATTFQPASSTDLPTFRFLVVDDNQSASHLLSKLLEKLGQEVRIAHSAETALAVFSQWQPQVVISDIAMPQVSGYELAERICRLSAVPRPMLIALTGYGQESDRQAALAAGFEEHLTKPIGMPVLQALLERLSKRLHALRGAS